MSAFWQDRALAQVVINEYSASNLNTTTDPQGDNSDWIELYNNSATAVSLGGLFVSDNPANLDKWEIPAGVTISGNSRKMIFCNDEGLAVGPVLCSDFKLTQTHGEWFILSDAAGNIIDSVHLRLTQRDHSRGRIPDGAATWAVFSTPTPNAINATAYTAYEPAVTMSVAPGFYTATQTVSLACSDPAAQIRYTTDGQRPTAASALYTGTPITVSNTTVLRAIAFPTAPDMLPSFEETNTYFINESVAATMNVVSVAGDFNQLFTGWGGNGIDNTFEFFDHNRDFQFELQGETRRHGNDSWAYPQKGFRFYARDEMGYKNEVPYQMFNQSFRDSFKVLIFKAAGSDNFDGGPVNSAHIRDAFTQTLAEKYHLEMDFRRYEPAVVYINGQYWGIYEIRERVDNDYTEYYYNKEKKDVDILKYWGGLNIEDGSDTGWVNLYNYIMSNSMAVQANYENVKAQLNVKSFIQYFILNTYLVNTDWLNWNTMWWRGRNDDIVKWRYALWDCDNVLDLGQNYTGMPSTDYTADPCAPFDLFQNDNDIKHTDMLVALMENQEFHDLYENQFLYMLNGPLNCENMMPHLDSLLDIIEPEMPMQCARWGGSYLQWQNNVQHLKDQIEGRCVVIAEALDSCMDLFPQTLKVDVSPAGVGQVFMNNNLLDAPYPWSQVVAAENTYQMAAQPTQPYWTFDHWEKVSSSNTISAGVTDSAINFTMNEEDSLVAFFTYYNPDSMPMVFDVRPSDMFGKISLNNTQLNGYPYSTILDRVHTYSLIADPMPEWPTGAKNKFVRWEVKHPDSTQLTTDNNNPSVSLNFRMTDTIIAYFDSVPRLPADSFLMIPNAFSPNGDGINDLFEIRSGKDIVSFDLKIFNRYGEMVWRSDAPSKMWDGRLKGKPCDVGVYHYSLKVKFSTDWYADERFYKGDINLIQ